MKSRVSWSYESNELLDVVESFLHNIVSPCPQLCGRHTGGLLDEFSDFGLDDDSDDNM